MATDTKLIAHEGMGSDMGIFLKRVYGDGHYGTLPNKYPLPSLSKRSFLTHVWNEPLCLEQILFCTIMEVIISQTQHKLNYYA